MGVGWETSCWLLLRAQVELGEEQVGHTCKCNCTFGLVIVKHIRPNQLKN